MRSPQTHRSDVHLFKKNRGVKCPDKNISVAQFHVPGRSLVHQHDM